MDNVSDFLTPNISSDPTIALTGSQAQQFNASSQQRSGSVNQQAFGIEYQIPFAIRYDTPIVITDRANNIGVSDPVGNGTGGGDGSNINIGPPGPPGADGTSGIPVAAGNDMNIQFNNSGTTDGSDNLNWDYNNNILDIEGKLQSQSNFQVNILFGSTLLIQTVADSPGDSGNITIKTDDAQTTGSLSEVSGNLSLTTGFAYGDAGDITIQSGNSLNGNGGDINIQASGSTNASGGSIVLFTSSPNAGSIIVNSFSNLLLSANVGGIIMRTLSHTSDGNPSGALSITSGDADSGLASGDITIATGTSDSSYGNILIKTQNQVSGATTTGSIILNHADGGALISLTADGSNVGFITLDANIQVSIQPYRGSTTGNVLIFFSAGSDTGTGSGIIYIGDRQNAPGSTPSNGGVLYSESGALHWLGSSGTNTTIAPA